MPGLIKLVNRNGWARQRAYYFNKDDIKRTIERWRIQYGYTFEHYFIHVLPNIKKDEKK